MKKRCDRCGYDRCGEALKVFAESPALICANCRVEMRVEAGNEPFEANRMLGESNGRAKLTRKKVVAMREKFAAGGVDHEGLAREFDTTRPNVTNILNRKRWAHVP